MSLFKKKEKTKQPTCCCGAGNPEPSQAPGQTAGTCCGKAVEGVCCVKVLGSGCASCHALYENACKAVKEAGLDVEVAYITELEEIMSYGVMRMPALVVNETVVSVGKVLKTEEIRQFL